MLCGRGGDLPGKAALGRGAAGQPGPPPRWDAGLLSLPLSLAPSLQIFVVELLGRRFLLLLGFSICFTACCVLTAALALQVRKAGPGGQTPTPRPVTHAHYHDAWVHLQSPPQPQPPTTPPTFSLSSSGIQGALPVEGGSRRSPSQLGRWLGEVT